MTCGIAGGADDAVLLPRYPDRTVDRRYRGAARLVSSSPLRRVASIFLRVGGTHDIRRRSAADFRQLERLPAVDAIDAVNNIRCFDEAMLRLP